MGVGGLSEEEGISMWGGKEMSKSKQPAEGG